LEVATTAAIRAGARQTHEGMSQLAGRAVGESMLGLGESIKEAAKVSAAAARASGGSTESQALVAGVVAQEGGGSPEEVTKAAVAASEATGATKQEASVMAQHVLASVGEKAMPLGGPIKPSAADLYRTYAQDAKAHGRAASVDHIADMQGIQSPALGAQEEPEQASAADLYRAYAQDAIKHGRAASVEHKEEDIEENVETIVIETIFDGSYDPKEENIIRSEFTKTLNAMFAKAGVPGQVLVHSVRSGSVIIACDLASSDPEELFTLLEATVAHSDLSVHGMFAIAVRRVNGETNDAATALIANNGGGSTAEVGAMAAEAALQNGATYEEAHEAAGKAAGDAILLHGGTVAHAVRAAKLAAEASGASEEHALEIAGVTAGDAVPSEDEDEDVTDDEEEMGAALYRDYAQNAQVHGRAAGVQHEETGPKRSTFREIEEGASGADLYKQFAQDAEAHGRATSAEHEEEANKSEEYDKVNTIVPEEEFRMWDARNSKSYYRQRRV